MLNPCARESKAQTEGVLRGKLISDHGLFSTYESQEGASNKQDSIGVYKGCTRLRTSGYWLACHLHQLKASTAMDLGTRIFLYLHDAWSCKT